MRDLAKEQSIGWQLEQAGELVAAERAYRELVTADANCADGWYRLGVVSLKQKKLEQAYACLNRSLAMNHKPVDAWNLQGVALGWLNRKQEAESAFRQAIACNPRFADAHANLGNALHELNQSHAAMASLREALRLNPNHLGALENLASVYNQAGQYVEAAECMQRVVAMQPARVRSLISYSSILAKIGKYQEAEAGYRKALQVAPDPSISTTGELAEAYLGLGSLLGQQQRFPESCDALRRAIALNPTSADAYSNLGNALSELGKLDEAEVNLKRAYELSPQSPSVNHNLGLLLAEQGKFDQAIAHLKFALKHNPSNSDILMGLGTVYSRQGKYAAAIECYECGLKIEPNDAQARFNLGIAHLATGDWQNGWPGYACRWQTRQFQPRPFHQPLWDGSPFPGKTLLLHCEQGAGDTIQFCRFAAIVKRLGGRVILECPAGMIRLLSSCRGVDQIVPSGSELPSFALRAPLLNVPGILGIMPENLPHEVPYLATDPNLDAIWSQKLPKGQEFRIGIAWRGNPDFKADRERSTTLANFEPLARIAGVRLYSLQKGHGCEEIAAVADRFSVVDLGSRLDETGGAFMETAAVMKALDLVISVDSAPNHLAGALGVPAWLPLAHVADWRWLIERSDTPWYPTMKLFRQPRAGDWKSIFERMASELAEQLNSRRMNSLAENS